MNDQFQVNTSDLRDKLINNEILETLINIEDYALSVKRWITFFGMLILTKLAIEVILILFVIAANTSLLSIITKLIY